MASGVAQPETACERIPGFLLHIEPWPRVFLRNLRDTVLRRDPRRPDPDVPTAPFWPDVLVNTRVPAAPFRQSLLCHIFIVVAAWGLTETWLTRPRVAAEPFTRNQTITYYQVSEYLPPIAAPTPPPVMAQEGDPEYARQPILSLPEPPSNRVQTVVNPSTANVLPQEARLPNLVAWSKVPAMPVAAQTRSTAHFLLPQDVVPVAPAAENTDRHIAEIAAAGPIPSVTQPPPEETALKRKLGELNMASGEAAPARPRITVPEQRAAGPAPGPAAPDVSALAGSAADAAGQLIALGVHPEAPRGPVTLPNASSRGEFAASPEGRVGATAKPGNSTSAATPEPAAAAAPPGIYVSGPPARGEGAVAQTPPLPSDAQRRTLMAAMSRPNLSDLAHQRSEPTLQAPSGGEIENQVFGGKRYYSMILNMPNLTSGAGSWIIRFAELKTNQDLSELSPPVAVHKVDPAYPAQLMRAHVEGVVVLYAVIHSDGRVDDVRVLRSVDAALDESARAALAQWQFRPAMKHGSPVATETVVHIPFTLPNNSL